MSESGSGAFCPRCGDPVVRPDDVELPGARGRQQQLCDACYFEQFDLVDAPETVQVRVCAQCGAIHRGNRWVDVGAKDYTDVAVEEVSEALAVHLDADEVTWGVEPEQVDPSTIRMHTQFSGVVRGTPVVEEHTVPVRISRETCTRCGRIAGDYFASIVQVRARDRPLSDAERNRAEEIAHTVVEEMEATGDRDAFVTEVSEVDEGMNVKVSTNKIGHKISMRITDQLGGSFEDHEKLVTEDEDGNEVYRVTYAVRLPPYTAGDIIAVDDDGPVLVRSVQGNLKGLRLSTGEPYEANYSDGDAPEARPLGTVDDAVDTTLVVVEDDHAVQVLDPVTYQTKTIPRPDYLDPDAESVPVFKHNEGLHVVPDETGDPE